MDKMTFIQSGVEEAGIDRETFAGAFDAAVRTIAKTVASPAGSWPDQPNKTGPLIDEVRNAAGVSHQAARAAIGQAIRAFSHIGSMALEK